MRSGIGFDEPLAADVRTLSPSDFGFHNAIRRPDGTLAFVDFEYFGWDDPAKTIADFLLHPGMAIDAALKRRFAAAACRVFSDVPALPARVQMAYALFGLKWVLILLNDFLPERIGQSTDVRRAAQLIKAQTHASRVAAEYSRNPFLS
jgi:thiamine kinase-like enzyme